MLIQPQVLPLCCLFYNHGQSNWEAASEFHCSNAKKKPKFLTQISPVPADGKQKRAWFITCVPSFSYLEQGLSLSAFGNASEYHELEISLLFHLTKIRSSGCALWLFLQFLFIFDPTIFVWLKLNVVKKITAACFTLGLAPDSHWLFNIRVADSWTEGELFRFTPLQCNKEEEQLSVFVQTILFLKLQLSQK